MSTLKPNLWDDHAGWIPNSAGVCPGRIAEKQVLFQFACGRLSLRPYRADSFNWAKRGWDFDIKAALVVEEDETK